MEDENDLEKIILTSITNVNNNLGNFYKETIYQNGLNLELNMNGLITRTEVTFPIKYKNIEIGFERADIVIYNSINYNPLTIIELKSQTTRLNNKDFNQLYRYINNINVEEGFIINFYERLEIFKIKKTHKVKDTVKSNLDNSYVLQNMQDIFSKTVNNNI